MTETELKRFTISLIKSKEKENEDYSNRIENVQIIKNDNMELIGKII